MPGRILVAVGTTSGRKVSVAARLSKGWSPARHFVPQSGRQLVDMILVGISRLPSFLAAISDDIYPEPLTEPGLTITKKMIGHCVEQGWVQPGMRVLDVGCGQGPALEQFRALGVEARGFAMGEDVDVCRTRGFDVVEMNISDITYEDASFDFIWCRHILEHSIFPYFSISELHRILAPGGRMYAEVPSPGTACRHELNPNHYSVLGKLMWTTLFERAGFRIEGDFDISFSVPAGPDTYFAFVLADSDGADAVSKPPSAQTRAR